LQLRFTLLQFPYSLLSSSDAAKSIVSLEENGNYSTVFLQLLLKSETRYYSQGTIIADSREEAKGLIVITSGQVCPAVAPIACCFEQDGVTLFRQVGAEIPVDSDDADAENKDENGSTLLCVFERG
jgi:hypothetical protein